ncbi:hypothetical protein B296_00004307 [Ensete ventricosum]|uniref:Uncharacterized protein n=1 Tax=Ensete ventricosum TaxID=4639 RepID=A0A427AW32_ENSVE|nr:hypothetical protein B296_00004307 [Ensete ventricosum]
MLDQRPVTRQVKSETAAPSAHPPKREKRSEGGSHYKRDETTEEEANERSRYSPPADRSIRWAPPRGWFLAVNLHRRRPATELGCLHYTLRITCAAREIADGGPSGLGETIATVRFGHLIGSESRVAAEVGRFRLFTT